MAQFEPTTFATLVLSYSRWQQPSPVTYLPATQSKAKTKRDLSQYSCGTIGSSRFRCVARIPRFRNADLYFHFNVLKWLKLNFCIDRINNYDSMCGGEGEGNLAPNCRAYITYTPPPTPLPPLPLPLPAQGDVDASIGSCHAQRVLPVTESNQSTAVRVARVPLCGDCSSSLEKYLHVAYLVSIICSLILTDSLRM